ncbi:MAG: hypothetical protein AB8F78_10715 [Saprospiraceae bacterium]
MTRIFLLSVALLIGTTTFAQQAERKSSLGIRTGLATYYGELNSRLFSASEESIDLFNNLDYATLGIDYETYVGNAWGLGFSYTRAEFSASDRSIDWDGNLLRGSANFNRSLNVNTKISQLSAYGLWSGNDGKLFKETAFFSPYAKLGIGILKFNSRGNLTDASNRPYTYRDGEVFIQSNFDLLEPTSVDATYDTDLRPLNT